MKKNIIITFAIIALIGVGFYIWNQSKEKKVVVNEDFAIIAEDTNKPASIEIQKNIKKTIDSIDYSTLEKDILYTKEEGKYENLSKVGKELLRSVLALPECVNNPDLSYCYDNEQVIILSSIVALKDGMLLLDIPNGGKPGEYYAIYGLKEKGMFIESESYFGTTIRDNKFIVVVKNPNKWINKTTQNLFYYKPGMGKFKPIPSSDILPIESYWHLGGMGMNILERSLENNVLTITIFNEWKGSIDTTIPTKLREVTFDLSTLQ